MPSLRQRISTGTQGGFSGTFTAQRFNGTLCKTLCPQQWKLGLANQKLQVKDFPQAHWKMMFACAFPKVLRMTHTRDVSFRHSQTQGPTVRHHAQNATSMAAGKLCQIGLFALHTVFQQKVSHLAKQTHDDLIASQFDESLLKRQKRHFKFLKDLHQRCAK